MDFNESETPNVIVRNLLEIQSGIQRTPPTKQKLVRGVSKVYLTIKPLSVN